VTAGSSSQTERLVAKFLDRTLPKAEWTHQAHLRVGLWHVLRFPPAIALDRLREGITRLNEAHGTPNTDTGGYHETITRLYVAVIAGFAELCDRSRPLDDLAAELIALHGDRNLPLCYYSRERLDSVAARRGWIEPDVSPLN
jgi:hypothetical protein